MTAPPPYQYDLPRELIAQEPMSRRADARLMVVDRAAGDVSHFHVRDLPDLLRAGDRLVMNNTRVVPAQLLGRRVETGGRWQGLYLSSDADNHWRIVCKTRGKLAPGNSVVLLDREGRDTDKLWLLEKLEDGQWLAHLESDRPAIEALEQLGRVPLPHSIRGGQMVDADVANYQTVFAQRPGSVAAPTAGLHFTRPLMLSLDRAGVKFSAVTLHVGLGTFRPIADGDVENHRMHAEWCEVTETAADEINQSRQAGERVIAVGTTSVRTLESAARHAADPGELSAWTGETDLFLRPGCEFLAVGGLLTNFHFPGTTLLLLVEALMGRPLLEKAYQTAIEERYRFYSYGDAMLIL
ncbi:MAG: tRNA preQ1(34) S-adenosylmethionine ribosyltransferase-isomerase QueA [Planctomycetota bacterium]